LNTSVASKPTVRADLHPAVLAVLTARQQRLPQLLDAVDDAGLCTSQAPGKPAPDDWFRGDNEEALSWRRRAAHLQTVCATCPVRAACEEAALRQGEGSTRKDADMVRGGRTGPELYQARQHHAKRLAAARAEDERAAREEKELRRIARELRRLALVHRDSRSDSRISDDIRETAQQLREARAARRARTGWTSAGAAA
jgi:WhiB family redox-sensing transcriptional regulator